MLYLIMLFLIPKIINLYNNENAQLIVRYSMFLEHVRNRVFKCIWMQDTFMWSKQSKAPKDSTRGRFSAQ